MSRPLNKIGIFIFSNATYESTIQFPGSYNKLNAFATEWLSYYVYVETEYTQGPWTRADMLEASGYRYLAAEAYEDLFGSGDVQLVQKLLSRLKAKKPGYTTGSIPWLWKVILC